MLISLQLDDKAKKTIRKLIKNDESLIDNLHIKAWLNEGTRVMCYILKENDNIVSFALLNKVDYDPLETHTNPILFGFIYTFENERNKGYGSKLVNHIKKGNQLTGFCNSDISVALFEKCGYSVICGILRFPPSVYTQEITRECIFKNKLLGL